MVAIIKMKMNLLTLILVGIIVGALPRHIVASGCGCATDQCCNQRGQCGTSYDFCGVGCQDGPCYGPIQTNDVLVVDIVTAEFFNGILDKADASCPGKKFYTRAAFIEALNSFNDFGRIGSIDDSKREIAAFFGYVTHEIGHFCYIEEIHGHSKKYYSKAYTKYYPSNPNKGYYGRGPIQLTWNFNYGSAGKSIGFDGLNSPETVANDPVISFKTALWYWMKNVHPIIHQGFGATIQAINYFECHGAYLARVKGRISHYTEYYHQLGVAPGNNITC